MSLDSIDYAEPDRLNGCNLYAYCGNNPIMYVDPSGWEAYSCWKGVFAFVCSFPMVVERNIVRKLLR
jgi:hypothetical protein